jgi:hypothetical protein
MSTDPGSFSQLDTLHSRPMPSSGLASRRGAAAGRVGNRLQDLSIVVERLFTFYEAMRTRKPLADGDEMLAQVRNALARSTRPRDAV